jgi:hypothetical protein
MTFSLAGETVPEAGTPGAANCLGKTISALAHEFGGTDSATSSLGFSSVQALQDGFLGGHPKSGHMWSLQNRPTGTLRNQSFLAHPRLSQQVISFSARP